MACGSCGNKNKAPVFNYIAPNGKVSQFHSEVQARAAVIKHGGSYRQA